jgi:hypothetical protein
METVVVTLGFRDDPHLDLLDESRWRLVVDLDEEWSLEGTHLEATLLGWVTLFQPPWFGVEIDPTAWLVLQWREDEESNQHSRARRRIAVPELIDVVPGRFHDWVIETTTDALYGMEALVPELSSESGADLDDAAAMLRRVSSLRTELAEAEEQRKQRIRRDSRLYGDMFLYDFAPETDLSWRVDVMTDGTEALFIRPQHEKDDTHSRVFIPASELSEWKWTSAGSPSAGGEYLTPGEVLARVPREFYGWVASKTHEALQMVRHSLYEQTTGTVADGEDVARVIRLAKHAQHLSGFSGTVGRDALDLLDEGGGEAPLLHGMTPDGRLVVLPKRAWEHVVGGHPEMDGHLDEVIETVENPEFREPDQRPGRERFFRRGGPEGWLRVVVEVNGLVERVVTAFPQSNAPNQGREM